MEAVEEIIIATIPRRDVKEYAAKEQHWSNSIRLII